MIFINAVPKDIDGNIILTPGASYIDENQQEIFIDGTVDGQWFQTTFTNIANAECPLSDDLFAQLKAIGYHWNLNANVWRQQGLI